jgi:hypothetical protein
MGVGVAGGNYDGSIYTYIETTDRVPIGFAEWHYSPDFAHNSDRYPYDWVYKPHKIDVMRESGLLYEHGGRANDVAKTIEDIKAITYCWKQEIASLRKEVKYLETDADTKEARATDYKSMYLNGLIDYSTYDAVYDEYNAAYDAYSRKFGEHNAKVEEYNTWTRTYNYLINNTDSINTNYQQASLWIHEYGFGSETCPDTPPSDPDTFVYPVVTVNVVWPTITVPPYNLPPVVLGP